MNTQTKPDPKPSEQNKFQRFLRSPWIFLLLFALLIGLVSLFSQPSLVVSVQEISYSEFLDMLDAGEVESVEVVEDTLRIVPRQTGELNRPTYYTTMIVSDEYLVNLLTDAGVEFAAAEAQQPMSIMNILMNVVYLAMAGIMIFWVVMIVRSMRKSGSDGGSSGGGGFGAFGFAKSSAKQLDVQKCETRFSDVAGQDEAKESLIEIVDILKNPSRYTSVGAEIPKGALLVGPPGTGKTLLAKAVAGEAGCPFFFVSGSAFVEMFVGTGAARVRDLFRQAAQKAPCIVFIDEIDAIGKKRDGTGIGGNDEREQTLNQLLAEMDGFDPEKGIIVLGATNRPEILDKALLRPGRFDRRIPVELPDLAGREAILRVHARQVKLERNIDFTAIARATSGASGAELANIINEAALRAVREGRSLVSQADLEECVETVIAGYQRKNAVLSDHEKRVVAYHEVGHALVAALQSNTAPVTKITIVPRTSGALGYTMQVDQDDKKLLTREELLSKIAVLTGGRAAEEVVFGSVTTGASNDIEQATKLARAMITRYGMSDEFGMVAMETISNQYLGGDSSLACSPDTATAIDKQVVEVVRAQHDKAVNLLKNNMASLNRVAEFLYREETITGEQFMSLLRGLPEPGETSADAQA